MPNGVSFRSLSLGHDHMCALDVMGRSFCWGDVSSGQVGDGSQPASVDVPTPAAMPEGKSFTALSAGTRHNCALDTGGVAYCWGISFDGALGNEGASGSAYTPSAVTMPEGVRFTSISVGWGFSCALSDGGQAYCWGGAGSGQSGNGNLEDQLIPTPVTMPAGVTFESLSVTGIGSHVCALSEQGATYCWGNGGRGRLGNGGEVDQSLPVKVLWD